MPTRIWAVELKLAYRRNANRHGRTQHEIHKLYAWKASIIVTLGNPKSVTFCEAIISYALKVSNETQAFGYVVPIRGEGV